MALYFVKNGGSDLADGLSDEAAWETLAQVNGSSFSPGDTISLRRGDTWREQLTFPSSGEDGNPITVNAYGSGALPIIRGDEVIATWAQRTANNAWAVDGSTQALWKFDGDLTDEGGTYDLSAGGTPAYASDLWDQALANPSTGGWGSISSTAFHLGASESFSIEIRFRISSQGTGTTDYFLLSMRTTDFSHSVQMWLDDNATRLGARVRDGTTTRQFFETASYDDDEWHTYSLVVDRSAETISIFLDGVQEGDSIDCTGMGVIEPTGDLFIGARDASSNKFVGDISEVRWMTAAITPSGAPSLTHWEASCTVEPNVVYFDADRGSKKSAETDARIEFDYWYDSGSSELVVASATDPDAAYTEVAAGQRDRCIYLLTKSWVTVQNVDLRRANHATAANMDVQGSYAGITIEDIESREAARTGIGLGTADDGNNTVRRNLCADNGGQGIYVAGLGSDSYTDVIYDNQCLRNTISGIFVQGNYWIVEGNVLVDNGSETPGALDSVGLKVLGDSNPGNEGFGNILRSNIIRGTKAATPDGQGILLDLGANETQVYYNRCYENYGAGITSWDSDSNLIYNNTCYGNNTDLTGTRSEFDNWGEIRIGGGSANCVVKNNIAYATQANTPAVEVDADSVTAGGHAFDGNCWFCDDGDFWSWNASTGATLEGWQTASGDGANDINANPLFADVSSNFQLRPESPCINAGVDVELAFAGSAPDIGWLESEDEINDVTVGASVDSRQSVGWRHVNASWGVE